MNSDLHLEPRHRRVIESLARRHLPGIEIWAYGSRVNGQSHDGSDLDIVLRGPGLMETPSLQLADFEEALRDSTLPFLVDVHDWARLPKRFHRRIEREYVVLAPRRGNGEWRMVRLGDCASLVGDKVDPADCGDLPYVGLEHIGKGTLTLLGTGTARDVESTKTAFRAGDILFGKLRPYFRKVVRPRFDGICSTDIWAVRPKAGVDAGYLFYLLASKAFVDFASQGAEGTRMPRAKWEHVGGFSLHLPPEPEQRAIARILGALDDKIELNFRMAQTLDDVVRTLFKSWFAPVNGKNSETSRAGYQTWRLGQLATISHSTVSPMCQPQTIFEHYSIPAYDAGKSPVVEAGSHIKSNKTLVPEGAVLVSRINPRIPRVWVTDNAATLPRVASTEFLTFLPKEGLGRGFLSGIFGDRGFQDKLEGLTTGTSKSHQRVSASDMIKLECVIGEPSMFVAFGSIADPLAEEQVLKRKESQALTGLRDTLLPKLISGEIRIQDAGELAAAAA